MDGFELNKIMGAVLGTLLFTLSLNIAANGIFSPHVPEKPGYDIEVPETPEAGAKAAAPQEEPVNVRLAKAEVAKGETAAKKCLACHSFEKGGPNKVGPNLWGVVGGPRAHAQGFSYSAGMKEAGGKWDFESLDKFLANPRGTIKGTSMSFAGIRRPDERADVIAYLNSLSDNPQPLPKPQEGAAAPKPEEGAAPKPQDGAAAPKPGNGTAAPKPQDGAAASKPENGAAAPKPQDGAAAPKSENGAAAPKPENGAAAPKPQDGAAAPKSENGAAAPKPEAGAVPQAPGSDQPPAKH